jgi:hypothetical protein
MPVNAVWLAWGSPDRKIVGSMRGRPTETWIYVNYTTAPYGYGYPYGPYGYGRGYGFGFTSLGFVGSHHRHGGRTFVFFGDPFYYSYIPPSIPYPAKIVSFASGRVVSFQYLAPPY